MKRFIFGFIVCVCLIATLVYVGTTQSHTEDLLLAYRRQAPFSENEMTYRYLGKPWFGKGLIFHKPSFPTLPVRGNVERLKLILTPMETSLYLSGTTIQISETLQEHKDLLDSLKSFQSPQDFLIRPLEGLAILGIDVFKGDIQITLRKEKKSAFLSIIVYTHQKRVIQIDTPLSSTQDNRLWAWLDCSLKSGRVSILDEELLRKIGYYYTSLGQPVPSGLKRALLQHEPFTFTFDLKQPLQISSLLKG